MKWQNLTHTICTKKTKKNNEKSHKLNKDLYMR